MRVSVIVTMDVVEHSFVTNEIEARALIEHMLRRDPRFHTHEMVVRLEPNTYLGYHSEPLPETAGDNLCNIFQDPSEESRWLNQGEETRRSPGWR